MLKSVVGIFISNVFIILLVFLNNQGPDWEVPVDIGIKIVLVWIIIIIGFIFSMITLLMNLKQFKIKTMAFKICYFVSLVLTWIFIIFLIDVEAYAGQFWEYSFQSSIFVFVSIINILVVIFLLRSKNKSTAK